MGNKIQKQFKTKMRKISRQEIRKKNRFYSYLERDIIYGYYSIKNRSNNKFALVFIKIMQYILSGFLLIFGFRLIAMILKVYFVGIFLMLLLISLTFLIFGFIHPNIIWTPDRIVSRKKVLKTFGMASVALLCINCTLILIY